MRGFQWLKRRRPAPGTVLGLIALIVALAGTAVAGPLATTSVLNKKDKKQIRKMARAEIAKAAPGLTVANAANAANAAQAGNAGTVDGHDATCPAATFLRNGVCFDNAARSDIGYIAAVQDCADTGGRLPSISELQSIRTLVDLGPAGDGHWADVMYDDDATPSAMTVYGAAGAVETQAVSAMRPYRCAYELVR
jgi:hypothetical protein